MVRLVILGGSSPFTAALVDQLLVQEVPPFELVLQGRNIDNLNLLTDYAQTRMTDHGWKVWSEHCMEQALEGAQIVLHQIRYGDMSGRAGDEQLAEKLGLVADETLGPGALHRLLALREQLKQVCAIVKNSCPHAWVLNLTNPLSVVTSLMVEHGLEKCVGLCELPKTTAHQAALQAGLAPDQIRWSYAGLNHRGFIVALNGEERDGIEILSNQANSIRFNGFPSSLIGQLQAIPTKYFHLMLGDAAPAPGRAHWLMELRNRILGEIKRHPDKPPESLAQRITDWYDQIVTPVIKSLCGADDAEHVVNLVQSSGIARELHAQITCDNVQALPIPPVSEAASQWITRFEEHERALLRLARESTAENLRTAVELDPVMSELSVDEVVNTFNDAR